MIWLDNIIAPNLRVMRVIANEHCIKQELFYCNKNSSCTSLHDAGSRRPGVPGWLEIFAILA